MIAALLLAAVTPAAPLLSPERIKADVKVLASDAYKGRGPAQAGEAPTLAYLEKRFRDLGMRVERQAVPMVRLTRVRAGFRLGRIPLRAGVEIAATSGIVGETVLPPTPMMFAGYGIVANGYDPYAGVDVKGKVVVLLSGDPDGEAGRDLASAGAR